ncbi:MAG: pyruvate:ferredoxin (flavodoxin) oxidoreductase [Calditrichaeota bacterium]|nr:pyruvate:ferredoxin (flavodoxin) oxidoreductase [Calditrichota bacterium]
MNKNYVTVDGNEACALVAHRLAEVCAIYPITPSSSMGELADEWSARGMKNIWGTVPTVIEMQSEGGAAGAVHGALQSGALTTTFTASQGLLLMIPNMYKIAGELTSTVFHVTARTIATHALSIFGDHSDVMTVRPTGWAMLASANVQEAHDQALIATAATLESRIPFVHFFDGFRTSHEVQKLLQLEDDDLRALIDDNLLFAHRARALSPNHPVIRGTAQNPDVFFQAREACNPYYAACPDIVQKVMDRFAKQVGRSYKLFEYHGAPDAERVIVVMGSGADTVQETVEYLNAKGEKVGLLKVRLYRPFSAAHFIGALPKSVKSLAVLDRTKEPGATGEPLYTDVVCALAEAQANDANAVRPRVVGGRYGLSSKEFTPTMVKAVFDNLSEKSPKQHFTVGIEDDVSRTSLSYDKELSIEPDDVFRARFYGLGADGTVGANKNSIKIIGDETPLFAQGYFVYDSKKSGAITVSHLRFGPREIRSSYLIKSPKFIACHQPGFLDKYDMLSDAQPGATFLLNTAIPPEKVWESFPKEVQSDILKKKIKVYCIDAYSVAADTGMGGRINTIMQTCFFAISGVLPREEAIEAIKKTIKKTYEKKGEKIVQMNYAAVDSTLAKLHEVPVPGSVTATYQRPPVVSDKAPDFVKNVLAKIIEGSGDDLPVSAFPPDGTFPLSTSIWEKRAIALEVPIWDKEWCIQCNKCVMVCPHAAIRSKVVAGDQVNGKRPAEFQTVPYGGTDLPGENLLYTLQVAPEDCTGCGLCTDVCPAKNKREPKNKAINLTPLPDVRERERTNWEYFLSLPSVPREEIRLNTVKGAQLLEPLFEFSGACSGCGETPYIKLLTQLYGDRMLLANATGCSSIYGANLPTTPYSVNAEGHGPAWANSLFEDNAEFGLGFRVTLDKQTEFARELVWKLRLEIGGMVDELLGAPQNTEREINEQRMRVVELREKLRTIKKPEARQLETLADKLVKHAVWIVGGDGWAYDIGYGGLDHVLSMGRNINILVLDTGVYSNTGGQCSKATPLGAVAKFAYSGKPVPRKDLAMMAINYGNVYVAQVAFGANDLQTLRAIQEAENYEGASLVIAYSHCIAHGIDMGQGLGQHKKVVDSAAWPLFRYDPRRVDLGEVPFQLDSKPPKTRVRDWAYSETRFKMLTHSNPAEAEQLMAHAEADVKKRWELYQQMAGVSTKNNPAAEGAAK